MSDKNDIVMINLDRPRMLWYGHRALKTLSALTGKNLDAFSNLGNFNFDDIEKVVYCGLLTDAKRNNETLKLEDMEDLLDLIQFEEIIVCIEKAFTVAFGSGVEQQKNAVGIATQKKKK